MKTFRKFGPIELPLVYTIVFRNIQSCQHFLPTFSINPKSISVVSFITNMKNSFTYFIEKSYLFRWITFYYFFFSTKKNICYDKKNSYILEY